MDQTDTSQEVLDRGRQATAPWQIPLRGWRDVLLRVVAELGRDQVGFLAAAIAFFAMLSLFPTLIAVISVYGLAFDRVDVIGHIQTVARVFPPRVVITLQHQALSFVQSPQQNLSVGFGLSVLAALWSSSLGAAALIRGLNAAYDEEETRSWFKLRLLALGFALGLVVFLVIALGLLTVVPSVLHVMGVAPADQGVFRAARWVGLAALLPFLLMIAYRYAPDRRPPQWQWVMVGALVASVLWLVASSGLAIYVDYVMTLNETYGAVGSAIVVMLWLYVSVYIVLVGAELNAELEHQTTCDSTIGEQRAPGHRRARMADSVGHVPPSVLAPLRRRWAQIRRSSSAGETSPEA